VATGRSGSKALDPTITAAIQALVSMRADKRKRRADEDDEDLDDDDDQGKKPNRDDAF
jgi:hypothetical protein